MGVGLWNVLNLNLDDILVVLDGCVSSERNERLRLKEVNMYSFTNIMYAYSYVWVSPVRLKKLNKSSSYLYRAIKELPTDVRLSSHELSDIGAISNALDILFREHNQVRCAMHASTGFRFVCDPYLTSEFGWVRMMGERDANQRVRNIVLNRIQPSKGCCGGCSSAAGYFSRYDFKDGAVDEKEFKQQLRVLKRKFGWTKKDGFYQEGLGCKLPRARRSITCLCYTCDHKLGAIANGLVRGLEMIRKRHNILA